MVAYIDMLNSTIVGGVATYYNSAYIVVEDINLGDIIR